jgi:hypothetical protein
MSCDCNGNENVDSAVLNCSNPCGVTQTNTAACESLPSQIGNFTKQFFGDVVKTEVDGKVIWSLPCSLDVGLPANPRGVDEGLACYFLRLFMDGITGLTGATGPAGADGAAGRNAYTVTLQGFTQPDLVSPQIQVITAYNPAIVEGLVVFITGSGWFLVEAVSGGTLMLRFLNPCDSPNATTPAGTLVVPAGYAGASVVGPTGPTGPTGPQGSPATNFTTTRSTYKGTGSNFTVPLVYAAVDFTATSPAFLIADEGYYMVHCVANVAGTGAVAAGDYIHLKLFNVTTASDIYASEVQLSGLDGKYDTQMVVTAIVHTTGPNQTIALYANGTTASVFFVYPGGTNMYYVRLE